MISVSLCSTGHSFSRQWVGPGWQACCESLSWVTPVRLRRTALLVLLRRRVLPAPSLSGREWAQGAELTLGVHSSAAGPPVRARGQRRRRGRVFRSWGGLTKSRHSSWSEKFGLTFCVLFPHPTVLVVQFYCLLQRGKLVLRAGGLGSAARALEARGAGEAGLTARRRAVRRRVGSRARPGTAGTREVLCACVVDFT